MSVDNLSPNSIDIIAKEDGRIPEMPSIVSYKSKHFKMLLENSDNETIEQVRKEFNTACDELIEVNSEAVLEVAYQLLKDAGISKEYLFDKIEQSEKKLGAYKIRKGDQCFEVRTIGRITEELAAFLAENKLTRKGVIAHLKQTGETVYEIAD
ncbi:hypothetical protein LYZ37_20385 [Vibrio tubiashii]|uniref:hypothetical protein n=1 Tax=Vibrio tubiashii TaxID=29498 RepID=UPI00234E7D7F|nr:hypothetical protein [Vibrio tubiashii]WCP68886.1 hypothetical protein LYZ37_20385 [Vibrio tubiashii]